MDDIALLKSMVFEYSDLPEAPELNKNGELDTDRIVSILSKNHDWTQRGAQAIVYLADEYGSFMLRSALALAIVLGKEDGRLGF